MDLELIYKYKTELNQTINAAIENFHNRTGIYPYDIKYHMEEMYEVGFLEPIGIIFNGITIEIKI